MAEKQGRSRYHHRFGGLLVSDSGAQGPAGMEAV
jgi:hypothetical protein